MRFSVLVCITRRIVFGVGCVALLSFSFAPALTADDWPTWRHDAARSAVSSDALSDDLRLEWTLEAPALEPAWAEDPRLQFDASYEPIVVGNRMFVASSRNDSVTAVDVASGELVWRSYAAGPIRFAPVGVGDRLYFGSDDGSLYCLDQATGDRVWVLDPGTSRRVLGNDRLISVHPVRGGAVVDGQTLYFTTGVWPFEGTFLYAVDLAASRNEARYTVRSLRDVAPQGYLVASGGRVLMPGGRAKVTSIDPATGAYDRLNYDAKGYTDYHASATSRYLFHGGKLLDREKNRTLPGLYGRPVCDGTIVYASHRGTIRAVDPSTVREVEKTDRKGKKTTSLVLDDLWSLSNEEIVHRDEVLALKASGSKEDPGAVYREWLKTNPLIVSFKAGDRLYGYQAQRTFAIDTSDEKAPRLAWTHRLEERPAGMIAASGRLFVVAKSGRIHCFGATGRAAPARIAFEMQADGSTPPAASGPTAEQILGTVDGTEGFAVFVGAGDVARRVARQSAFRCLVLERDAGRAASLRRRLDEEGLLGKRVSVLGEATTPELLPPYIANLLVVAEAANSATGMAERDFSAAFRLLRPYGGTAVFPVDVSGYYRLTRWAEQQDQSAVVSRSGDLASLRREGALAGSADWKREYGDESNTLMSRDTLVKAPLGVLWFGGPAGDASLFYNRHNWPPSLTVIDGRMFIQGPGTIASVDIYTGRVLWRKEIFDGGGSPQRRRDLTLVSGDRMGNPIFGTPPAGYHFLVESDALYLAYPNRCLMISPATGERVGELRLPDENEEWGRIRIHGDLMIVSVLKPRIDAGEAQRLPHALVALDRRSGAQKWRREATNAFPYVTIGGRRVIAFDAHLEKLYRDRRRGNAVPNATTNKLMLSLDLATGEERWRVPIDMVANWLSFSEEHNIIIASNSEEIRAMHGSNCYTLWSKKSKGTGFKGHPENLVHKVILWKDRVIDQRGPGRAYDIRTGVEKTVEHPLTGEQVNWEFTKIGHHCNYAIASEHLMTFRAGTAGFYDLDNGGTSHLEGFRSGCRNSLIPAGGILNSPNFANGCICSYSIFTSLAFVHVPENEKWSYSALEAPSGPIKRLGVNLGAPGDRRSGDGTLWLDHPSVGGPSPKVAVKTKPESPRRFRRHSSQVGGAALRWVCASGVTGVTSISISTGGEADTTVGEDGGEAHVTDAAGGVEADAGDTEDGGAHAPRSCTVRLFFVEPDGAAPGERVFSVRLQGSEVLGDFDPSAASGGVWKGVVKEFHGVKTQGELVIELVAKVGEPVLCGVEVVADPE